MINSIEICKLAQLVNLIMQKKNQKLLHIVIILLVLIISFFAWNTFIIYPIKLFVVLLHEMSHGLVAVLTGGKIISIELNKYLGGLTTTEGGNILLIASAGYLGSIGIGALLFISSFDKKVSTWFNTALAVLMIIFAANFLVDLLSQITALLAAALLIVSPRYFNSLVNQIIMQSLGLVSAFYVLIDIKEDLLSGNNYQTDAVILENITSISAAYIGILWLLISALVIYFLIRKLILSK